MRVEKKVLGELERCYATTIEEVDNGLSLLVASEGKTKCLEFRGEDFSEVNTVWDEPGGTMSIVTIPNTNGEFLAVQQFWPTFDSALATIVYGKKVAGQWQIKKVLDLPYCHRFDILTGADGTLYFLGGVLCNSKQFKDDWQDPGRIVVCELPSDLENGKFEIKSIQEGLTKHHGYTRANWYGTEVGICTAEEGIFRCVPPKVKGGDWEVVKMSDLPTSDISVIDLDGDGKLEYATIESFHGDKFRIYKEIDGNYQQVFEYEGNFDFGHVVKGVTMLNKPTFLGGARKGDMELFAVTYEEGEFKVTVIDKEVGPSNVDFINLKDKDLILSANRQIGEIAIYYIYEE